MGELIRILDKDVERIEYRGMPVVTLRQVDELHERPTGTTRKCFNRHRDKLVGGEDFFVVPYKEWMQISAVHQMDGHSKQHNAMIFLTESGYLMVVKPYTDERSWQIQRILIKNYFTVKQVAQEGFSGERPDTVSISKYIEVLEENRQMLKAEIDRLTAQKPVRKATKPLTNEEIVKIYDLETKGLSGAQIAREIGRSSAAVSFVLKFRPSVPMPAKRLFV